MKKQYRDIILYDQNEHEKMIMTAEEIKGDEIFNAVLMEDSPSKSPTFMVEKGKEPESEEDFQRMCVYETAQKAIQCEKHLRAIKNILLFFLGCGILSGLMLLIVLLIK